MVRPLDQLKTVVPANKAGVAPTGPVTFKWVRPLCLCLLQVMQRCLHDSSSASYIDSWSPVSEGFVGDPWLFIMLTYVTNCIPSVIGLC
jgi:hypothetical protein